MNVAYLLALLIVIVIIVVLSGGSEFVNTYLLQVVCTIILAFLLGVLFYRMVIMI